MIKLKPTTAQFDNFRINPHNSVNSFNACIVEYETKNNINLVPQIEVISDWEVKKLKIINEAVYETIRKDNIDSKQVILQILHWLRFCYQNKYRFCRILHPHYLLTYQNRLFIDIWGTPITGPEPDIKKEYESIYDSVKCYLNEDYKKALKSRTITDIISLEAAIEYIQECI